MARRISEDEWALMRHDRERKGFSYNDLVKKYGVSKGAIMARAKRDNWQESTVKKGDYELRESLVSQKKRPRPSIKKPTDNNAVNDEKSTAKPTDKPTAKPTANRPTNRPRRGTELDDFERYLDELKKSIDPSRVRGRQNNDKNSDKNPNKPTDKREKRRSTYDVTDEPMVYQPVELENLTEKVHELTQLLNHVKDIEAHRYHPIMAKFAKGVAILGGTPKLLAEMLDLNEQTIYNWQKEHMDFRISWLAGKHIADQSVATSLYRVCTGYTLEIKDTKVVDGEVIQVLKGIHVPPDTRAIMYWLNNRCPENWKQNVEYLEPPKPSLVDNEANDERYRKLLDKAKAIREEFEARGEHMNLVMDGKDEE